MRIKRGVPARAKHKKILKAAKGMQHYRTRSFRLAKQGVIKALRYSYRDRRTKKRDLRALWITRINNAARAENLSYSQLIKSLKAKNITLDRKILADLAINHPNSFTAILKSLKQPPKTTPSPNHNK
jgi:large subunit ribosomal protein L20